MLFSVLSITLTVTALIYTYISARKDTILNPVLFFTFFQIISFWGTIPLLDLLTEVDVVYYFCYFIGIFCSYMGFILGDFFFPVKPKTVQNWKAKVLILEKGFVYDFGFKFLALFSALVCFAYFYAVGYNVFLLGFINLLSVGEVQIDASSMRLASYNSQVTGEYYYPGFVNQFKDILFPLSMFYLWSKALLDPHNRQSYIVLIFFSIAAIISIMGTGQRGAFAVAMITGCSYIICVLPRKIKRLFLVAAGTPAILLFMISTFINGRTHSDKFEVGSTLDAMWRRIASDNQWGAHIGFNEVMYPNGIQWGKEWWDGILGFTPWHTGSTLDLEIAGVIYGGFGNAPPSNWGSIYYNFGWFGIIFYPLITCIVIKYFYFRFYKKKKTTFRILIYVYAYFLFGSWIAGSPITYYFNIGLTTIFILKILLDVACNLFGKKYKIIPVNFTPK